MNFKTRNPPCPPCVCLMRVTDVTVMTPAPKDLDSGLESLLEVFPQFRGEAPSCSEGAVNALHVILMSNPIDEDVRFL